MAASDESAADSSPSASARDAVILAFARRRRGVKARLRSFGLKILSHVPTSPHSKARRERAEHPSAGRRPPVDLHLYRKPATDS